MSARSAPSSRWCACAPATRSRVARGAHYANRTTEFQVVADNDESRRATVIEVRGPNVMGVLHRVARAFGTCQLDIRHAKVLTVGDEVVDSFYVVDADGGQLTPNRIDEVTRAVTAELAALL